MFAILVSTTPNMTTRSIVLIVVITTIANLNQRRIMNNHIVITIPFWIWTVIAGWSIGNLILGILIGKYHERWEWNKLIQQKKIPAPVKTRR